MLQKVAYVIGNRLYYICASGGTPTHLYHCADDLLFDLQYYGCNFKELVDCGDRLEPFTCPTPDGKFPIRENACDSRYYVCINNNASIEVYNNNVFVNLNAQLTYFLFITQVLPRRRYLPSSHANMRCTWRSYLP